ncbi:Kelch-like protein 3 [Tetrabaena socialis]|uniref:Kelch-like protein 3 n=1 Tax=Tetrabaena socialis TaxID=47790 RepID=A0A2J7ZXT8_9CHLO|nr:Kelch-like protein 3 [Tetrabaena socialis]|eukprot:PNH05081.1 Kelch-like protein 3 [Tetrabaena socialis]
MQPHDVLAFLGGVRDVRELSAALACYCTEAGFNVLLGALCDTAMPATPMPADEVTNDMHLIAQLAYGPIRLDQCTYVHLAPPTACGLLAVARVGAAVLACPTPLDPARLAAELARSTVSSLLSARQLCLAALQASITPCNCFSLFQFAEQAGIAPLRDAAAACCLASMPRAEAPAQDQQGFSSLPQEQLQSLLQSDELKVSSEKQVFEAIAAWAHARPRERVPHMGELVARCVRLASMGLRELEALDQEPHVVESQEVTRVVAHAYIMKLMGAAGFGGDGVGARRSVQQAAATAMAAGLGQSSAAAGQLAVGSSLCVF